MSKQITYTLPPLGLAYVAASVENLHEVSILDSPAYDYSCETVICMILANKYDLICLYTLTPTICTALKIAKEIRKKNKDIKIVLGGPHASGFPEKIIKENHFIDFVVVDEGEITFPELLAAIEKGYNLIKEFSQSVTGRS